MSLCPNCLSQSKQKHFNSKWCKSCAEGFKHRPRCNLTEFQKKEALRMRGKYTKEEIAKKIGASRSGVMRLGRDLNLSFNHCNRYKANPQLVKQVCKYYEKYGKIKTQKKFPHINVRSIVEHYNYFKPRQTKWTESQIKDLAQMAGIISMESQAKFFQRPNAHKGSIISVWMKNFKRSGGSLNGISWNIAKHFVTNDCKPIQTKFWSQRNSTTQNLKKRKLVLWTEINQYIRPELPIHIKEAIACLSRFQEWLYGTCQVAKEVNKMIQERE